jgi:hypothetical protein
MKAFRNIDPQIDIEIAWETTRNNIKISAQNIRGYFEVRKHKPGINEGHSKLLDQSKYTKVQWLQELSKKNGNDRNNIRREANRHFKKKISVFFRKTKLMNLQRTARNNNITKCIKNKHI